MSANLLLSPSQRTVRPEATQAVLASGVYAFMLRECLSLYEDDAKAIETAYGIPASHQWTIGYRSVPETRRTRVYQVNGRDATQEELCELQAINHSRFDEMSDDDFFDWLTYSKERLDDPLGGLKTRLDESRLQLRFVEHAIKEQFGAISGVPGLYTSGDELFVKMPRRGILTPCRRNGWICALQSWPRPSESFWFSSAGLEGGASVKASIHVSNIVHAHLTGLAMIVPQTIEADALAWDENACAVAVNGLSPLRFVRDLRATLPELKACAVAAGVSENIARTLRENGLKIRVAEVDQ